MTINERLASELGITLEQVERTAELIDEDNTIPFIARYRKEVTGSLDDTVLRNLDERLKYLRSLEKRREEVRAAIEGQEKLTPEIEEALNSAMILTEIEDIYRPFRPKRRTRASVARERGLEELAALLLEQKADYGMTIDELAAGYADEEKEVPDSAAALAGARDIIAEDISDSAEYRRELRRLMYRWGTVATKKAGDDRRYEMYYDRSEPVNRIADHRILAVNRAEKKEQLAVTIELDKSIPTDYLLSQVLSYTESPAAEQVTLAVTDSWERLIEPSIEREIRAQLFDRAAEGAIKVFSLNLHNLLMQAPLKGMTALGLDPGYRTGCKLAVIDRTGKVLDTAVIYPHKPQEHIEESGRTVRRLIEKYGVDVVAIGNGTASKESEIFIANLLKSMDTDCKYAIVSEAGASVYSASKLAAEEFPDFDVTQRSAVSIARRLLDPLAELVKIDPKAIGVGQYQHDMKPAELDSALAGVVEDCVNTVGVDLNTASHSLLSYVAGINSATAKNIVTYREENGEFKRRAELLKVPRIGARTFEQCAGFLRVPDSSEVLDCTAVHPESYDAARSLLKCFGYAPDDVRANRVGSLGDAVAKAGWGKTAGELGIGEPTLRDIVTELEKPGRDVRDSLPLPELREDVLELSDLKPGMELTGTVRNVTDFGAFIDIGVHQDGLAHITELSKQRVKHPSDVVAVGDIVRVRILSVDCDKGRISLTLKI